MATREELDQFGEQATFNAFDLINKNLAAGVEHTYVSQGIVANQLIDDLEDNLVANFQALPLVQKILNKK